MEQVEQPAKMTVDEFMEKVGGFSFDVNPWGSCQYSGALSMFNAYFKKRESGLSKKAILAFLEAEVGISIFFDDIRSFDDAQAKVEQKLKERYGVSDSALHEIPDEYARRAISLVSRSRTADDLFMARRSVASDLWNTAPLIADAFFKNLEIKIPVEKTGLEEGPVCNVKAQSINPLVGLCCALLVDHGIVKNQESFSGFDT